MSKKSINATLINLYHVCPRELWLHANHINMEQNSAMVYDGKLIHENSYGHRNDKHHEFEISACFEGIDLVGKIDFYDAKHKTIHETKRSNKAETAHQWQLKFYIWLLKINQIEGVVGLLEYPESKQTTSITLEEEDERKLECMVLEISRLLSSSKCPPIIEAKICKSCSYYELCYIAD
jgi:CRISPR-associated exonuclease Cas4